MSIKRIYEQSFDEDDGKTINRETCPECDGVLRTVAGETTCEECGLIADEYRIDHSATYTSYADDEKTTEQTGSPLSATRHDRGLSSEIGSWRDGRGNELSPATRRKFSRLRRHHGSARYRSKAERNLIVAFTEIGRLTGALDLPYSVREQACTYFRSAHRDGLQGRSIDAVAAASVYAACRCGDCTRVFSEVAEVAGCEEQALRRQYQFLNAELGLQAKPPLPTEFVPRLASMCDVPTAIRYQAMEFAKQAVNANLHVGRKPVGLAGACLYLASEHGDWFLTQRSVAEAADVTTMTLRTRSRELREKF